MNDLKMPLYEDEIEEIILPDNDDKKKNDSQAVTVSASTAGVEKNEEKEITQKTEEER